MNKNFTANQSIWIAAALYAYIQYENIEIKSQSDFCLKAVDLKKMAEEFTNSVVQSPRIYQHLNGDHDGCTQRFIRRIELSNGNSVYRVTAKNEFAGQKEYPADLDFNEIIEFEGKEYSLKDIKEFMDIDYPVILNSVLDSKESCTRWMIAGNPKQYDVIGAFAELGKIDWRQTFNARVGDIIYIYVSDTIKEIRYKCRVNKTDLEQTEIEDSKFDLSGEFDGSYGRYMELEPIKEYSGLAYGRKELMKHGFKTLLGPMRVPEELQKYLDNLELEGFSDGFEREKCVHMKRKTDFDKNMILYGPPGTGKTYNTAIYAVSICDPEFDCSDYEKVMERYNELKSEGRIVFTTFHQSYGYEEFIEGIKPVLDEDSDNVGYTIEDGVFKSFCKKAGQVEIKAKDIEISEEASVWKATVRNEVRQDCFQKDRIRIDWDIDSEGASGFVNDIKKGDIIITTAGSRSFINGIAIVTGEDAYVLEEDSDTTTRDVKWLAIDISEDIKAINAGKMLHRMTCARVPYMKAEDIILLAQSKNNVLLNEKIEVEKNTKPYVFIIDEINRGNISKIFGELITLIENTKRAGMKEAASAILPYSGESFSVPNNVYILGTMNTADRSIAIMDTALRRRFQFIEMMPKSQVLRDIGADRVKAAGIELDVAHMLDVINERIEYLFDREHTIGHAFFTGLKDEPTVEKLASIFKKSVIPLLQEYFYEDYSKIMLVLGDNGKAIDEHKFILETETKANSIFKGDTSDIDIPDYSYQIQESAFNNIMSYIEITD